MRAQAEVRSGHFSTSDGVQLHYLEAGSGPDRPVLFVASAQVWAVAVAEEIRAGWPDVQVEVIDETSHALFVDRPDAFNRVLEKFLATLPD